MVKEIMQAHEVWCLTWGYVSKYKRLFFPLKFFKIHLSACLILYPWDFNLWRWWTTRWSQCHGHTMPMQGHHEEEAPLLVRRQKEHQKYRKYIEHNWPFDELMPKRQVRILWPAFIWVIESISSFHWSDRKYTINDDTNACLKTKVSNLTQYFTGRILVGSKYRYAN